ncbi:MAG: alpha/beta fold hydrolase [Actinomycetota bacterium]
MQQRIRFTTSFDGATLAYATHGSGPPLVKAAQWFTHLEFDWESPIWRHWLEDLGRNFTVLRYDERGCGLSDREPGDLSVDTWVKDLEAVTDAAGFERFALLGISGGGPVAISYAVRHAERVSQLVLYGSYLRGRAFRGDAARAKADVLSSLIKVGWGGTNPAFRRVFTNLFVPDATEEQVRWFDEMQVRSTSAENAIAIRGTRDHIDVTEEARLIRVPTLVLQADEDAMVPFEEGRLVASTIPNARFVPLEGRNHILLADEPAWPVFLSEVLSFVGAESQPGADLDSLTSRELEVLRLVAAGLSNAAIGREMFLSERTVERHLSNIYTKLGLTGKAARAAGAALVSRLGAAARQTQ